MALTTRLPSPTVEPFYGFVDTTGDAMRLIQAARQGHIPRITRRLNDLERRAMIRSGSVFVFSNDESGIKRWTEGLSWSASRIVGNFLVYREVSDRSFARGASSDGDRHFSRRRVSMDHLSSAEQAEKRIEKSLVGCLADGLGRFKADGMIKKTITIKIEGSEHHLVAYYKQEDVRLGRLPPLSTRADIMALDIPSELLESTKFRFPPKTEPGPDGRPRYICDSDETETLGARFQPPFAVDSIFLQQPNAQAQTSSLGSPIVLPSPSVAVIQREPSNCTASSSSAHDNADFDTMFGSFDQLQQTTWPLMPLIAQPEWPNRTWRKISRDTHKDSNRRAGVSSSIAGSRYTPYSLPQLQLSSLSLPTLQISGTAVDPTSALSAASDIPLSSTADCANIHHDRYYYTPPSTPLSAASSGASSLGNSPSGLQFASQIQSSVDSLSLDDTYSGLAQPFTKDFNQIGAFFPVPFASHVADATDVTASALTCFDDDYSSQFAWIMN